MTVGFRFPLPARLPPPLASLLTLLVLACIALPASAMARDATDAGRQTALALVNQSRAEQGLPPLDLSDPLIEAARSHAEDMAARNYFSHVAPDGDTALDRYRRAGGGTGKVVAENIGRCSGCAGQPVEDLVRRLHRGWMNSPGHRANILKKGVSTFGFALEPWQADGMVAVQTFAGPGATEGPALTPAEARQTVAERINAARDEAGVAPLTLNADLSEALAERVPDRLDAVEASALQPPLRPFGLRQLFLAIGQCGGCGRQVTAADVERFVGQWLKPGRYRDALLDPAQDVLGVTLQAAGDGRKIAVAAVGH